jgi:homeobox protein cut-like
LYKVLADAPDPYPLLEAAIVRITFHAWVIPIFIHWFIQDQTVKIAEAGDLEDELQRVKAENAELQKRVSELANIDGAKKKAESRAEQLEEKARLIGYVPNAG